MKKVYVPFLILILFLFTSCAKQMMVRHYIDPGTNFLGLQTYNWIDTSKTGGEDDAFLSEELDEFIHTFGDKEMMKRGLAKETEKLPDGFLIYHVAVSTSIIVSYPKMAGVKNVNLFAPEGLTETFKPNPATRFEKGTMVVDLLNGTSGALVWRGVAYGAVDTDLEDDLNRVLLLEALQKIFQKFPTH